MIRTRFSLTCAAIVMLGAGAAAADCREELAQLTQGISKDGSLAPLQSGAQDATPQEGAAPGAAAPDTPGVAKDGSETPMGADPNLATSAQDAQAQSMGGDTAAAQAAGAAGGGGEREEALARAQAALQSGDEAGCMAAVGELKAH